MVDLLNLELSTLLRNTKSPMDVNSMTIEELKSLTQELKTQTIKQIPKSNQHLRANLAVVDLTVTLHHLFNTPYDKILWDIGYQSMPHKILTGHYSTSNLSTNRSHHNDNIYELFDGSHAGSTLSAASGLAEARSLFSKPNHVVCVINDISLGSGATLEAIMQIGASASKLIIIINHSMQSLQTNKNSLIEYLERVASLRPYHKIKNIAQEMGRNAPESFRSVAKHAEEVINNSSSDGELFEQLGFLYTGPLDGHEIGQLIPAIKNVREREEAGPVLVHVITDENKNFQDSFTVPHFQTNPKQKTNGFLKLAVKQLSTHANIDNRIVFVSSNLSEERPISALKRQFANRFYEFPMSDQHVVSFAAGLACEGLKPFVFMRSAFFAKCSDQIMYDVAMQKLPVRFIVDGAGLSAKDGPKYAGIYDVSMLNGIEKFAIMAPADGETLTKMLDSVVAHNDSPSFIKFPDFAVEEIKVEHYPEPMEIGKGRIIKKGHKVAILSFGIILKECLKAQDKLIEHQVFPTVADACFANPLDEELILKLVENHDAIVCVEDGPVGGFCSSVAKFISDSGYLTNKAVVQITISANSIPYCDRRLQSQKTSISADHIVDVILKTLQNEQKALNTRLALAS